jgi:hypothetical protein
MLTFTGIETATAREASRDVLGETGQIYRPPLTSTRAFKFALIAN